MMKKLSLITLLSIAVIHVTSCKKDAAVTKDTSNTGTGGKDTTTSVADTTKAAYYIKFKADTATYNFGALVEGNFNKKDASGHYDCSITGQASALAPGANRLVILLTNPDSLVINKYYQNFGTATDTTSKALLAQLNWYNGKSQSFMSWGKELDNAIIADTRLKFTAVTKNTLKGTFSGTVYIAIDALSEKHKITNGEFYVQREP